MDRKTILIYLSLFVLGLGVGYYEAPTKIQIEKQVLTTKQAEEIKSLDKTKEKIVTQVKQPDGTEKTRIRYINRDVVTQTKAEKEIQIVHETKEIIKERRSVTLSGLVGYNIKEILGSPTFGGQVMVPILGPIFIEAHVLTNGEFFLGGGISL